MMDLRILKRMKSDMAKRGNWKEVKRINKMIELHSGNYAAASRRGRYARRLEL